MFKKFRFISLVLVAVLLVSNISMAAAPKTEVNLIQEKKEFYKTIKEMEKYLVRNEDGTLNVTKIPNGNAEYIESILSGMAEINEQILNGYLESDENLRIYANEDYILKGNIRSNKENYVEYDVFFEDAIEFDSIELVEFNETSLILDFTDNEVHADSYSPPVGLYFYWWGWELAIDNATTLDIIDVMNIGAGSAAIAAILQAEGIITAPSALVTEVISGVLWIGGAAINLINRNGGNKGVYFRGLYSVPPLYYCWARS